MKLFITFLIAIIPSLCLGQIDINSIDSLAKNQANKYLLEDGSKYVLLYEFGCLGCEVGGNCYCEFGDTQIYIISDLNKISKFNCCEKIYGEINNVTNHPIKGKYRSNKYFENTFKYDYLESHSDFYRIELISIDTVLSVQFPTFLFNDDYEFRNYNLNQNSKIMVDEVIEFISKEGNVKWKKEDNN